MQFPRSKTGWFFVFAFVIYAAYSYWSLPFNHVDPNRHVAIAAIVISIVSWAHQFSFPWSIILSIPFAPLLSEEVMLADPPPFWLPVAVYLPVVLGIILNLLLLYWVGRMIERKFIDR